MDAEAKKRERRLDSIQAKFDAEGQPITHITIPDVLGTTVAASRLIALATEALKTGELPR